jgi:hypothetical protein
MAKTECSPPTEQCNARLCDKCGVVKIIWLCRALADKIQENQGWQRQTTKNASALEHGEPSIANSCQRLLLEQWSIPFKAKQYRRQLEWLQKHAPQWGDNDTGTDKCLGHRICNTSPISAWQSHKLSSNDPRQRDQQLV